MACDRASSPLTARAHPRLVRAANPLGLGEVDDAEEEDEEEEDEDEAEEEEEAEADDEEGRGGCDGNDWLGSRREHTRVAASWAPLESVVRSM